MVGIVYLRRPPRNLGEGVILFEANVMMNSFPLAREPQWAYLGKGLTRAKAAFDPWLSSTGGGA